MTPNETKKFIKKTFVDVLENMNAMEKDYSKYFSQKYIQYVDGKTLNYNDFVAHMKAQKDIMKSISVTFKYLIVEGDKVATIHLVNGVKKNGGTIEAQVNAIFHIKDHKIILCDELTHLIKGEKSDSDLGSRK